MWAKPLRIKGWTFNIGIPQTWFFGYQRTNKTNLIICILPFIAIEIDWTYVGLAK